jgi:hypothetical protein
VCVIGTWDYWNKREAISRLAAYLGTVIATGAVLHASNLKPESLHVGVAVTVFERSLKPLPVPAFSSLHVLPPRRQGKLALKPVKLPQFCASSNASFCAQL